MSTVYREPKTRKPKKPGRRPPPEPIMFWGYDVTSAVEANLRACGTLTKLDDGRYQLQPHAGAADKARGIVTHLMLTGIVGERQERQLSGIQLLTMFSGGVRRASKLAEMMKAMDREDTLRQLVKLGLTGDAFLRFFDHWCCGHPDVEPTRVLIDLHRSGELPGLAPQFVQA